MAGNAFLDARKEEERMFTVLREPQFHGFHSYLKRSLENLHARLAQECDMDEVKRLQGRIAVFDELLGKIFPPNRA